MAGRSTEGAQRMSDDAQTPGARENTGRFGSPAGPPARDVWPAPADGGAQDAAPLDASLVDAGGTDPSVPAGTRDPAVPAD
ncbi:hypothetical protein ACPF8X_35435, partial [Streptomyces sp. G35A]